MVIILRRNENFTPYIFYTSFLDEVAADLRENDMPVFKLFEFGDDYQFSFNYYIDPISIPLFLSLAEQLSNFYQQPLELILFRNAATENVLSFLFASDFFHIAGRNTNPSFPKGRGIFKFDETMTIGAVKKIPRPDHKVRCYSLKESQFEQLVDSLNSENERRDFLVSEYIYQVREHFQELLFDNSNTYRKTDYYVEILSELITNGVLHSKSNTYALMFVNNYSTKFSISDNGIGFAESLKNKTEDYLYKPNELIKRLEKSRLLNVNKRIEGNLNSIFEALYYSSLKNRRGLFDLMISVVYEGNGYFRLHTENAQIIISNRMRGTLRRLREVRLEIYDLHKGFSIIGKDEDNYRKKILSLKNEMLDLFETFYRATCEKYNNDYKYSSVRFYNVKFRGVHIEVEIPTDIL